MKGHAPRHRLFLKSGVTAELNEGVLRDFFEKIGKVTDVYVPKDPATGQVKGFAFIAFDSQDVLDLALKESTYTIQGIDIPVAKADPRSSGHDRPFRDRAHPAAMGIGGPAARAWPGAGNGAMLAGAYPATTRGLAANAAAGMAPRFLDPTAAAAAAAGVMDPYLQSPYAALGTAAASPGMLYGYADLDLGRRGGGGGGHAGRGGSEEDNRIFVGGVPDELSREDVKEYFEQYGAVMDVYFPKDKSSGRRRNFCYVRFATYDAADAAVARSKRAINGHDIHEIRIAQPRPPIAAAAGGVVGRGALDGALVGGGGMGLPDHADVGAGAMDVGGLEYGRSLGSGRDRARFHPY